MIRKKANSMEFFKYGQLWNTSPYSIQMEQSILQYAIENKLIGEAELGKASL